MNKSMTNYFVAVTPFQLYFIDMTIRQYFTNCRNIIISTVSGQPKYSESAQIVNGNNPIKILQIKRCIYKDKNNSQFFVPHLGTLYSSWLYSLANKFNIPINVYYEGIALLYDPPNPKRTFDYKRLILSIILRTSIKFYSKLYPLEFRNNIAYCYIPFKIDKMYKNCQIVEFNSNNDEHVGNNLLILTSNYYSDMFVNRIIHIYKNMTKLDKIYLKPHYSLKAKDISLLKTKLFERGLNDFIDLDPSVPIEEYLIRYDFNYVLSQDFSSALVNINIMSNSRIIMEVDNKNSINESLLSLTNLQLGYIC